MQLCLKKKKKINTFCFGNPEGFLFSLLHCREPFPQYCTVCVHFLTSGKEKTRIKKSMSTRGEMRERSDDITGGMMCVRARRLRQL